MPISKKTNDIAIFIVSIVLVSCSTIGHRSPSSEETGLHSNGMSNAPTKAIEKYLSPEDTLFKAIVKNDIKGAEYALITLKADVNKYNSDGVTPLMVAAGEGAFEIVELLLKNGANKSLNFRSKNFRQTAILRAAIRLHYLKNLFSMREDTNLYQEDAVEKIYSGLNEVLKRTLKKTDTNFSNQEQLSALLPGLYHFEVENRNPEYPPKPITIFDAKQQLIKQMLTLSKLILAGGNQKIQDFRGDTLNSWLTKVSTQQRPDPAAFLRCIPEDNGGWKNKCGDPYISFIYRSAINMDDVEKVASIVLKTPEGRRAFNTVTQFNLVQHMLEDLGEERYNRYWQSFKDMAPTKGDW